MTHEEINKQLLTKGYYFGNFEEFFQEDYGVSREDFAWAVETFRESSKNIPKHYRYRHNFTNQNTPENYTSIPGYAGPIPTEEEFLEAVSYDRIEHRKQYIEEVKKHFPAMRTTQQWFFIDVSSNGDKFYRMNEIFEKLIRNYCKKIYPHLDDTENFMVASQYSIYNNGDFSEIHHDGINPGRACVIIMYFSDSSTYNDGGGHLVVEKDPAVLGEIQQHPERQAKYIKEQSDKLMYVKPLYGNFAMLDFVNHNLGHSIELVKNNFTRLALQSFVGP